jgi:hypothetical protein
MQQLACMLCQTGMPVHTHLCSFDVGGFLYRRLCAFRMFHVMQEDAVGWYIRVWRTAETPRCGSCKSMVVGEIVHRTRIPWVGLFEAPSYRAGNIGKGGPNYISNARKDIHSRRGYTSISEVIVLKSTMYISILFDHTVRLQLW